MYLDRLYERRTRAVEAVHDPERMSWRRELTRARASGEIEYVRGVN